MKDKNAKPPRNATKDLSIKVTAVVVAELALLAQGELVLWIQPKKNLDKADWKLFEEVKQQAGFNPPFQVEFHRS